MNALVRCSARRERGLRIVNWVIAGLIPLTFAWFAARYVGHVVTVRNVDYFQFVELAERIDPHAVATWVNGMHPNGYPLLIRGALALGLDAVQAGHALSVIGGILLLVSAYILAYRLTGSPWVALLTEAFLGCTGYLLYFGTMEGNDMLSAGLQGLALALLVGLAPRKGDYLAAGVLAGLAYLIRYTAVVTSALCLAFLIGIALARRERAAWQRAALYLVGFLVGAALQLVPSAIATGNPFYSVRGRDLWWHVEGRTNFATEWRLAPDDVSPLSIFLANPRQFVRHWWDVARSFWISPSQLLLDTPLRLLTQAGLLFTLLAGKEIATVRRALLAVYTIGLLGALALIRYDPRFQIVLLPILVFCTVYFLRAIVPPRLSIGRVTLPLVEVVLLALLGWASSIPLGYLRVAPTSSEDVLTVTNVLRAAGMESAQQVLSSAIPLHDASVPARSRYAQSYWVAPDMDSQDALLRIADEHNYRFVLYDTETGLTAHPGLAPLLDPNSRPTRLTPLLIPQDLRYILYRVEMEPVAVPQRLDVHLGGGVALSGYEAHVSPDVPSRDTLRLGLFLYWRADERVSEPYKVFVHVMNAQDQLIAQDDSVPALWTYATDVWQPGETVVDFHAVMLPANLPPGVYAVHVGMYSETTGQRLSAQLEGGAVQDKVTVTYVTVESDGEGRLTP
ncbi:MAG: glycosyltransferase family 39 protein [Anaerolineales bacterium]|nr:glycosyltransferase family 39 protein [Anaerolineales bacterium]